MAEAQASGSTVPTDNPTIAKDEDPLIDVDTTEEVQAEESDLKDAMSDLPPPSPKRPSADSGSDPKNETVQGTSAVKEAPTTPKKTGFFGRIKRTFSPITKLLKSSTPVVDEPVTESTSEGTSVEPTSPLIHLSDQEEQAAGFNVPKEVPSGQPAQEGPASGEAGACAPLTQQSPEQPGFFRKLRSIRFPRLTKSKDSPAAAAEGVPPKMSKQDRVKNLVGTVVFKKEESVDSGSTESEMLTSAPITPDPFSPPPENKMFEEDNQAEVVTSDPPTEVSKEAEVVTSDPPTEVSKEAEVVTSDPPIEVTKEVEVVSSDLPTEKPTKED